jgi:hypothetical protein
VDTQIDVEKGEHLKQLRWSLQALVRAGSEQRTLFPDAVLEAEQLASDFTHRASVVRSAHEQELSQDQIETLAAVEQQLNTMSRDGAEFDLELWSEAALANSADWEQVRRLASSALEAFGWPLARESER